jgi:hypothetical protein
MPPRKVDNQAERIARLERQLERLRLSDERTIRTVEKPQRQAKANIRDTRSSGPRRKR